MTNPTRRSMRHDITADTVLHITDAPPFAVTVCNISRHGVVIDSLAQLVEDDIIHVELEPARLRAARVIWQDGFRTGLELIEPFEPEDYWPMLKQLTRSDEAA